MTRVKLRGYFAACFVVVAVGSASGRSPDPKRTYPAFDVGPTGIVAKIENGSQVIVTGVGAGLPAAGKIEANDVLLTAQEKPLQAPDPRVALGEAIGAAEAANGALKFHLRRGQEERDVELKLPVLGPYAETWPLHCPKTDTIVKQTIAYVVAAQQRDGSYRLGRTTDRDGVNGCLCGIFLLSTGEAAVLPNVALQVKNLTASIASNPTDSVWALGYQGILLGEYFERTGDQSVLPALKKLCDRALRAERSGAWGHYLSTVQAGYTQSGLMNSAGIPVIAVLNLARECGVEFDEKTYQESVTFFFRMVGHGSICYGDHRAEVFPDTGGRNGMMACAFSLMPDKAYQDAARHLALLVTDAYPACEEGHTGDGFNVIWRGLSSVLIPADRAEEYQRQMRHLAWYYDLCRLPGGGFRLPPVPPDETMYCGPEWGTPAVGLTYTAPRKQLRITGAAPSKYAIQREPLPAPRWGRPADSEFLRCDDAAGYVREGVPEPHEIYRETHGWGIAENLSPQMCANLLRHHNPMIRIWAARRLVKLDTDFSRRAIEEALSNGDPRVRRAALDGISGYDNWNRPTYIGKANASLVTARYLPLIEKILNNREASWWELDGALWALGVATPDGIRKNAVLIREYQQHAEWYLREAAFWAEIGLGDKITGRELKSLMDCYVEEAHVFPRGSYDQGIHYLLKNIKVGPDSQTEQDLIKSLGATLSKPSYLKEYGEIGRHEAVHRTMMLLRYFDPQSQKVLIPDIVTYLQTWTPATQHSRWLISGSEWQPGFVALASHFGPDSRPIIDEFRKLVATQFADLSKNDNKAEALKAAEAMKKAIADFDAKK